MLDDTVTIDGTFTIPSKATSVEFYYESAEEHELCTLTWYGNVSLPTNVTFQNFWLMPKATAKEGAAPASVALNRNTFHLENSGGVFTNVTGSTNSEWQIATGDSTVLRLMTVRGWKSEALSVELHIWSCLVRRIILRPCRLPIM